MKMRVFVVMHEHDLDGCDEVKFIGVYSTACRGRAAIARAKRLPGFRDHPDGFAVGLRGRQNSLERGIQNGVARERKAAGVSDSV
jgi:hypothetical protein